MNLKNKLSIKSLTIINLMIIGLSAVVLSLITSVLFKDVALEDEKRIVTQMTTVTTESILHNIYEQASTLGLSAGKSRKFRRAFKKIKLAENKEFIVQTLDKQFKNKELSEHDVNLRKIRVYDKNFKLLTQSNKGVKNLPKKLPDSLHKKIKTRKGSQRLKTAHALWMSQDGVVASVLVPVGGLRLRGYMEIIISPTTNLITLEHILSVPIQISDVKGKQLYRSSGWNSNDSDMLAVEYLLKTDAEKTGLRIEVLENLTAFNQQFSDNMLLSITLFLMLIAFNITVTQMLFSRVIFTPLKKLASDIQQCANGDLTVKITHSRLTELKSIGDSFFTFLTSLKTQVSELKVNATHVTNASTGLTTITDETMQGAKKQQNETEEVATAINEMSATVREVANHAEAASRAAQHAEEETNKGQKVVLDTIKNINDLESDLTKSARVLETLRNESENIGSVMNVIQGIAEQTNLLSLNAAIEAARAGEQGRGFAVVADEVRVLAGRTQDSSKEIQSMIGKIQTGASQAVDAMNTSQKNTKITVDQAALAGESLESVASAVKNISDMNTQIASAAEEQRAVTSEISKNIDNISRISMITTTASSKTATASESLLGFAKNLDNLIVKFKI